MDAGRLTNGLSRQTSDCRRQTHTTKPQNQRYEGVKVIKDNYHTGEAYQFNPAWLEELRHYEVADISKPDNQLLLTQTGDETLNWEDGWDYYGDCHRYCGLGGSHAFDNFDAFIPLILRFCGVSLTSAV